MGTLTLALLYATLAGATIPLGGLTARVEQIGRASCRERVFPVV